MRGFALIPYTYSRSARCVQGQVEFMMVFEPFGNKEHERCWLWSQQGRFCRNQWKRDPGEAELRVQACEQPCFNLQESLLLGRKGTIYCKRADIIRKTYPKTRDTVESAVFFADEFDSRRRIEP